MRTEKGRKKGREKEKRESHLGTDQTELCEHASIIINQDVNNEGTDGSESGQRAEWRDPAKNTAARSNRASLHRRLRRGLYASRRASAMREREDRNGY